MRNAFITTLMACAESDSKIFLIVGDLGFSVVEPFAKKFPERFLNAGVAEQNLTGVAAGLAMAGYKVFTYSIANFPTLRCLEQIRNDICYHHLNVTIVTVGGGLGYGPLGYSHHAVQDIACLRTFPGILMATPGDQNETIAVTQALIRYDGPAYLRLGKGGEPSGAGECSISDVGIRLIESSGDSILLFCGGLLGFAAPLAKACHAGLASIPLWTNDERTKKLIQDFVAKYRRVVVVEEHLAAGGFGSFVREALESKPHLQGIVRCCALDASVCGQVGTQDQLRNAGGLNIDSIRQAFMEN